MRRKSFWISISLVMLIVLALFSLFIVTKPRQIDLSYDSSPQKIIMYADMRWYPGIPPLNEPACLGQTYPSLRVWGDGTVFYEYWATGQPEPSYWTGDLTSDQIHSILNSLASHGFFSGWTPDVMNPAGQFLNFGVHITQKDIEYTGQEVYPAFFNQIIDQIKPQLVPADLKTMTDFRIISLIDIFQSCFSTQKNTPEPPKPTLTPTLTPSPSPTVKLKSTSTRESTQTQTPFPPIGQIPMCSSRGIPKKTQTGFGLTGLIIYQDTHSRGLYSLGGFPLTYSKFPVDQANYINTFGFSPDGNYFAYSPIGRDTEGNSVYDNPRLVVMSAAGEISENGLDTSIFKNDIEDGYRFGGFGFGYWINDNFLYTSFNIQVSPDWVLSRYHDISSIIDPFTGTINTEVMKTLDNLDSKQYMGFSPDMRKVFYQSNEGFILYDLDAKRQIWNNQIHIPYGVIINWSFDGSKVAYMIMGPGDNRGRVSIVPTNGEYETIVSDSSFSYQIGNIGWSPDSQNLAIIRYDEASNKSLLIYSVPDNKYIFQCPIVGDLTWSIFFWSPDSENIVFGFVDRPMQVVNIISGETIELSELGIPAGWSDKFQSEWP